MLQWSNYEIYITLLYCSLTIIAIKKEMILIYHPCLSITSELLLGPFQLASFNCYNFKKINFSGFFTVDWQVLNNSLNVNAANDTLLDKNVPKCNSKKHIKDPWYLMIPKRLTYSQISWTLLSNLGKYCLIFESNLRQGQFELRAKYLEH